MFIAMQIKRTSQTVLKPTTKSTSEAQAISISPVYPLILSSSTVSKE